MSPLGRTRSGGSGLTLWRRRGSSRRAQAGQDGTSKGGALRRAAVTVAEVMANSRGGFWSYL